MEGWPYCYCNCGSCYISVNDSRISLLSAYDILEWANNVLVLLEDNKYKHKGIPSGYNISCTNLVYINTWILPKGMLKYTKSDKYSSEVKNTIVSDICHCMIKYTRLRNLFSEEIEYSVSTLSAKHIEKFKQSAKNQYYYSVIKAGLNNILICDT